jgi:soluble lytic murein transglycosylase-like protein
LQGDGATEDSDAETNRIESDLERIERDPAARGAFYARIDRLVDCIRNNREISPTLTVEAEWPAPAVSTLQRPAVSPHSPALHSFVAPLTSPVSSLSPPQPQQIVPRLPGDIQEIKNPQGGAISPHVISRLLYWATKNGCPPQLALATAWQESRMSLRPPDGSSGEIGIMQILPARAEAEGIDPRRLRNPDVDMWLGTKLLARYYREEGSIARAAMKYVAGPRVFRREYSLAVKNYIGWYSKSVQAYAVYFAQYVNF